MASIYRIRQSWRANRECPEIVETGVAIADDENEAAEYMPAPPVEPYSVEVVEIGEAWDEFPNGLIVGDGGGDGDLE